MANKVIISCDSTCDLSEELITKYNIKVFSLPIVMDDKSLKDGIEITPDDIFAYKKKTGRLVKTSAPNIAEFLTYFGALKEQEDTEIVHFNISAEMSSTNNNAIAAGAELGGVYAVDSRNLSTGAGLLVLRACALRDKGLSAKEIYDAINELARRVDASFVLDTLEYMHKGGRCSGVTALGANLLQLKPCIEVKDGQMGVGKKYRGKLLGVHANYVADRLHDPDDIETDRIFITHSGCSPELVEAVRQKVQSILPFDDVIETRAGCSVSVHCGPNTLGILFIRKSEVH